MKEQEQPDNLQQVAVLTHIWALPLQLPLRRTIGKNILGPHAAFALLFVVLWGGLTNSPPVLCWAGLYFVSICVHRTTTLVRRYRGTETHSFYDGYPLFGDLLKGRFDEVLVKSTLEPLLIAVIGLLCAPFGEPAVLFFIGGSVCMFVSTRLTELQHRTRIDNMRDAIIEGEIMRPGIRRRRW